MTHAQPADGTGKQAHDAGESELPTGDEHGAVEAEYHRIIQEQLERMGACGMTTLEVAYAGDAPDGLGIYRAMIRVVRWERRAATRLLLGLPVLQYKLAQVLAASWLPDVSHFGGVWLHPAGELQQRDRVTDLRRIIVEFESQYMRSGNSRFAGESLWSVPGEPPTTTG